MTFITNYHKRIHQNFFTFITFCHPQCCHHNFSPFINHHFFIIITEVTTIISTFDSLHLSHSMISFITVFHHVHNECDFHHNISLNSSQMIPSLHHSRPITTIFYHKYPPSSPRKFHHKCSPSPQYFITRQFSRYITISPHTSNQYFTTNVLHHNSHITISPRISSISVIFHHTRITDVSPQMSFITTISLQITSINTISSQMSTNTTILVQISSITTIFHHARSINTISAQISAITTNAPSSQIPAITTISPHLSHPNISQHSSHHNISPHLSHHNISSQSSHHHYFTTFVS